MAEQKTDTTPTNPDTAAAERHEFGDTEKTWKHNQRERIAQILVKNNLRTDQVAILELLSLVEDALNEGETLAYAKRNIRI